jgi:7-cyano-7-deazaguanine synthase in queuosine biosynthesis
MSDYRERYDADERLIAAAPRLRDALRGVLRYLESEAYGCWSPDEAQNDCGKCPYCLAWRAAHDALKEVGDAE